MVQTLTRIVRLIWALDDSGNIILYNRTSDTHARFCKIDLSGDTVFSILYLVHTTPTYNNRSELLTGYNSAHSLQNYVYFTKGTGFHDISINNGWDVSKVTSMAATFYNATNFNQSLDSWDVSSVTSMYWMFRGAENFNQDLNSWTTSGLYNTTFMFNGAYKFNGAIGNWDTSNVTDI